MMGAARCACGYPHAVPPADAPMPYGLSRAHDDTARLASVNISSALVVLATISTRLESSGIKLNAVGAHSAGQRDAITELRDYMESALELLAPLSVPSLPQQADVDDFAEVRLASVSPTRRRSLLRANHGDSQGTPRPSETPRSIRGAELRVGPSQEDFPAARKTAPSHPDEHYSGTDSPPVRLSGTLNHDPGTGVSHKATDTGDDGVVTAAASRVAVPSPASDHRRGRYQVMERSLSPPSARSRSDGRRSVADALPMRYADMPHAVQLVRADLRSSAAASSMGDDELVPPFLY